MATISASTNEKVYHIPRWLGLNEHPDGDTRLKMGEASKMVNWKITRDGNLKRRPGMEYITGLCLEYTLDRSPDVVLIGTINKDEILQVSDYASVNEKPGKVTLTSSSGGLVEKGTLKRTGGTITDGVLSLTDDNWYIENGKLVSSGATTEEIAAEDLYEQLRALDDGEFLYCIYDETPYALNNNSLTPSGKNSYQFNGYLLTAIPVDAEDPRVKAVWSGLVMGKQCFLAACNDGLWRLWDDDTGSFVRTFIGEVETDKGLGFVPFDGKVYILNGYEYYCWDGTNLTTVEGYRPLVAMAIAPDNAVTSEGVTTGEHVNRLNGKRRVWVSPDGTNKTFTMPEKPIASVDWVKDLKTGSTVSGYTTDLTNGKVTFTSTPAKSVNSYEIAYTVSTTYRSDVTGNLYGELYSGTTDARIFIYGDGTNRTLYSGMDYNGQPRADYFPDQYEARVGDANTPITAMVRHYSDLVCYKTNECWALNYTMVTLATGEITPALTVVPVNRDKGNIAPGQVRLVDNNPVTCSSTELYHWINSSYYSSHLSRDERQARRISDRIQRSIKDVSLPTACMWDDNDGQEFYICGNGIALVWNYTQDVWYRYENFDAVQMCNFRGDVYIGTSTGRILKLSYDQKSDDGRLIEAEWESGAMDFGADYMRKYIATLWVGLKPEKDTSVDVTVITDKKNTFRDKIVSSEKAKVAGEPFMVKTKIKAKKFTFYRLILKVIDKQPAVTVTNIDFRVRQTGYTK